MSKTYSAGIVTAYGAAKRAGYQGTYEDFCRQQAGYAESAAAVEQAKNTAVSAANTATTKAREATTAATDAQTAKTQTEAAASQALTDISIARSGAISAVQTEGQTQTANARSQAQAAAQSANTASTKASEASASATSAGQSATNAAASATSAATSASAAQAVLDSIPEDYSDLSKDVDDLKADLKDALFNKTTTYSVFVQGVRYADGNIRNVINNPRRCASERVWELKVGDVIAISDIASGTQSQISGTKSAGGTYTSGWKTSDFSYTVAYDGVYAVNVSKTTTTDGISTSDVTTVVTVTDNNSRLSTLEQRVLSDESSLNELKGNTNYFLESNIKSNFTQKGNFYVNYETGARMGTDSWVAYTMAVGAGIKRLKVTATSANSANAAIIAFYDDDESYDASSYMGSSYAVKAINGTNTYIVNVPEGCAGICVTTRAANFNDVSIVAYLDKTIDDLATLTDLDNKVGNYVTPEMYGALGDGLTDDSQAIQNAINAVNVQGGGIVQFGNKTYVCQGLLPKDNVTLRGAYSTTLTFPASPTNHLIYYYSDTTLKNFNLVALQFNGPGRTNFTYDFVHVEKPSPFAQISYVWDASIIDTCVFKGANVGIYCSISGNVKIVNTICQYNNIGIEQYHEHFHMVNVMLWANVIGANIHNANHFTWVNVTFAHNDNYGIYAENAFESGLFACSFIDNTVHFCGPVMTFRIIGCRFITADKGIYGLKSNNLVCDCYFANLTVAAITCTDESNSGVPSKNSICNNMFVKNEKDIIISGNDEIISGNSFSETAQNAITLVSSTNGTMGIEITNNRFWNCSKKENNAYAGILITSTYIVCALIANNVVRNDGVGKMSYAIEMDGTFTGLIDILVANNVSRNMKTAGYKLKSSVTTANNIGTITTF